jgi:hypothetical protein
VLEDATGTSFDWEAYVLAEWRSNRSRELDKHGGLTRRPVRRLAGAECMGGVAKHLLH